MSLTQNYHISLAEKIFWAGSRQNYKQAIAILQLLHLLAWEAKGKLKLLWSSATSTRASKKRIDLLQSIRLLMRPDRKFYNAIFFSTVT
ncbi:hypothetical protein EYC80_006354 [Monilinia laxa]|uniref:Uncharacterized protein n=1 Tax=Monilinia laxa TaxID=61186 RepID=A0A5N6JRP4_MONLA|nr:hypothetical protein EYC80_006354 [Monilinia laxa]